MTEITITTIENRIALVEVSYRRQLNLVGKPGYDQALLQALKKDLIFLHEQKDNMYIPTPVVVEVC